MTDNGRELKRRFITSLLSAHVVQYDERWHGQVLERVAAEWAPPAKAPELDTARKLALAVSVGEPDAAVSSALADFLLENGHESAVYEKGKIDGATEERKWASEERERNYREWKSRHNEIPCPVPGFD